MKINLTIDLAPHRAAALEKVEAWAASRFAALRRPGRDRLYDRKSDEAASVLAGLGPAPLLEREAAATGVTLEDLAGRVAARAAAEETGLAAIELGRQTARAAIRAAKTTAAIAAALENLEQ